MTTNASGPAVSSTRLLDVLTDLVAALESGVLYEMDGAWFIGMHGDSDVTDIMGEPLSIAKNVLSNTALCVKEQP